MEEENLKIGWQCWWYSRINMGNNVISSQGSESSMSHTTSFPIPTYSKEEILLGTSICYHHISEIQSQEPQASPDQLLESFLMAPPPFLELLASGKICSESQPWLF